MLIKLESKVTKNKITSTNAHKLVTRQKQYENLLDIFINNIYQHQIMKDQVKYDKIYHLALDIYRNVLRHYLHRDVNVRPARYGIQLYLFWKKAAVLSLFIQAVFIRLL